MPDAAIVLANVESAPKDYTLTGSQEIVVKSVRAVVDGTSAASAFLPTLQLLDPNGNVMWEGSPGESVAAGASADVSWFQGGGLGGGGGGTNAEWFRVTRFSAQSMGAGANDTIVWTSLHTSDSSLFSLGTDNHPNDAVVVSRLGVMAWYGYVLPDPLAPNFALGFDCNVTYGLGNNSHNVISEGNTLGVLPAGDTYGPRDFGMGVPQSVPAQITGFYKNFDAAPHNLSEAAIFGIWIPTATFFP